MDEILARLQETSQKCLASYAEWVGKKRDTKAQETLQAAIHELRKVASRLEIEVAVSERDQMTARHIPIPSHRSMNTKDGNAIEDDAGFEDDAQDFGNGGQRPQAQQGSGGHQQRRRLPQQRRPTMQHGGGGQPPSGG